MFDPVHRGHIAAAEAAKAAWRLDEVWMMITARPPHKRPVTPLRHRLAMLRLALKGRRGFKISLMEAKRPGYHYAVDTLRRLGRKHLLVDWIYLMGGDAALGFKTWKSWKAFHRLCTLGVVSRPGFSVKKVRAMFKQCGFQEGREYVCLNAVTPDVSSTTIRKKGSDLPRSRGAFFFLDRRVADYIKRHRLYEKKT